MIGDKYDDQDDLLSMIHEKHDDKHGVIVWQVSHIHDDKKKCYEIYPLVWKNG